MKNPLKPRDKITQKMSRDGLTEQKQTTGETERISRREQDADFQKTPEQQVAQDAAVQLNPLSSGTPARFSKRRREKHRSKPPHSEVVLVSIHRRGTRQPGA